MAQGFLDFEASTLDALPAEFINRWASTTSQIVRPDTDSPNSASWPAPAAAAMGDQVFRVRGESSFKRIGVEWVAGSSSDELYAVLDLGGYTSSDIPVLILRGAGTSEAARTGYSLWFRSGSNNYSIRKVSGGSESTLASGTLPSISGFVAEARFSVVESGSDVIIEGRFWEYGGTEPVSPDLTHTDTSPLSVGWCGVGCVSSTNSFSSFFGAVGYGTNGDPALREPSGGGTTFEAGPGTLHLTGQQTSLALPRTFTAAPGSLHLTGRQGAFTTGTVLSAQPGTLHLTGQAAVLEQPLTLAAQPGALQLTGQQATLAQPLALTATPGTLHLTGQPAALTLGQTFTATPGQLTVEGQGATLSIPRTLTAQPGVLQLTGQQAALATALVLTAGSGIIELVGQQAVFTAGAPELPPAGRLFRARLESRRFRAVAPQRYFRG